MRDIQRGTKIGPPTRFEFKRKEKNPMKQGKNRKKKRYEHLQITCIIVSFFTLCMYLIYIHLYYYCNNNHILKLHSKIQNVP